MTHGAFGALCVFVVISCSPVWTDPNVFNHAHLLALGRFFLSPVCFWASKIWTGGFNKKLLLCFSLSIFPATWRHSGTPLQRAPPIAFRSAFHWKDIFLLIFPQLSHARRDLPYLLWYHDVVQSRLIDLWDQSYGISS
jgi:hypothetical protein